MRIPIGPLLNFEDGLNPRTGSAFSARLSSTSPKDFMFRYQLFDYFNESGGILCTQRFACTHGVPMYTPVNTTVPMWLYTTTTGPLVYTHIHVYPCHIFITVGIQRLKSKKVIFHYVKYSSNNVHLII